MKQFKFLLLAAGFSVATIAFSQEIPRQVFASGGGQDGAGGVELSWTIGQSGLTGTLENPSVVLNTGFQQFDNLLVSTDEIPSSVNVTVFPNPFKDRLFLNGDVSGLTKVNIRMYDHVGRLVFDRDMNTNNSGLQRVIETPHLTPGMYSLLVSTVDEKNQSDVQLFKLINY